MTDLIPLTNKIGLGQKIGHREFKLGRSEVTHSFLHKRFRQISPKTIKVISSRLLMRLKLRTLIKFLAVVHFV